MSKPKLFNHPAIVKILKKIEEGLEKYLDAQYHLINNSSKYLLLSGGKKLRPLIMFIIAEIGNRKTNIIPLAVGLEYIHTASLLHDDVIDEAEFRRGKKAVHKHYGIDVAILTGDYLYANALYLFSKYGNQKMINIVSSAVKHMAEGQLLEIRNLRKIIDEETYFRIIDGKTGVLFASATAVGALASEKLKEKWEKFWELGLSIGRAFLLIDDALDYSGEKDKLGKPIGLDLKEGKITYPLLSVLSLLEISEVTQALQDPNYTQQIIKKVIQLGGIEKTKERAKKEIIKAKKILNEEIENANKNNEYFLWLNELLDFIIERIY